MRDIGYYLYENVPLHTKFQWMAQAPGSAAVDPTRAMLGNTGNAYKASDDSVRDTLKALGIEWRGTAADAAGQALHRAADRSGTVGSASSTGSGSVAGYGHSFEAARAKVHWEDPGTWDWWERPIDVTGLGIQALTGQKNSIISDFFATAERNRTLDAEATRALYEHESASRAALAGFPVVDPAAAHPVDPAGAGGGAPSFGGHVGGPGGPGPSAPGANLAQPLPQFGPAPGPVARESVGTAGNPPSVVPHVQQGTPAHVGARPGPTAPGTTLPAAPAPGGPPGVTSPRVTSPHVTSPDVTSPRAASPRATSPQATSPQSGPTSTTTFPHRGGPNPVPPGPGIDRSRATAPSWRDLLPPISATPPGGSRAPIGDGVTGGRSRPRSIGGGADFAERMPPRTAEPTTTAQTRAAGTTAAGASRGTGTGIPFMGGMGAGAGGGATERKARYVIPSSEHFEVPMPPHPTGVIEAEE